MQRVYSYNPGARTGLKLLTNCYKTLEGYDISLATKTGHLILVLFSITILIQEF